MTSQLTVSGIKGNGFAHGDGRPRAGTKLRAAYDALRRGEVVNLNALGPTVGNQLRMVYGMEIEGVSVVGKGGRAGSRLVGEWEGPYFVPLERILQDEDA